MASKDILVIGGGVGGLSAGWQIAKAGIGKVTILERNPSVGGVCSTLELGDFKVDLGPHKLFSLLPGVIDETLSLFDETEILKHRKRNRLFVLGNYLDYPIGFRNMLNTLGFSKVLAIGSSLISTRIKRTLQDKSEKSYEDYIISRFGDVLYSLVFKPLAIKVWGDPKTLSMDIASTRIPASNAIDVLLRAIGLKKENNETNVDFFFYPKKGFGQIPLKLHMHIEKLGGKIKTNVSGLKIYVAGGRICKVSWFSNGDYEILTPDLVISAFSLQELLRSIEGIDFQEVLQLADELSLRHLLLVYLFFDKANMLNDHWIFVPDKDIIFSRIYEPKVLSGEMAPYGKTAICCDFTTADNEPIWKMSDGELGMRCMDGLEKMHLINKDDIVKGYKVVRIKNFYPYYKVGYRERLSRIIEELRRISNIICTGRLGMYNYNNFDHCMHMGMIISKELKAGSAAYNINNKLLDTSLWYKIVD